MAGAQVSRGLCLNSRGFGMDISLCCVASEFTICQVLRDEPRYIWRARRTHGVSGSLVAHCPKCAA